MATENSLKFQRDTAIRNSEQALANARAEWEAALEMAQEKRKARESSGPGKLEAPEDTLRNALKDINPSAALAEQASRISAIGTFNAENLLGLQAGSAVERMAAGIDKIEKNTRPLRDLEEPEFG